MRNIALLHLIKFWKPFPFYYMHILWLYLKGVIHLPSKLWIRWCCVTYSTRPRLYMWLQFIVMSCFVISFAGKLENLFGLEQADPTPAESKADPTPSRIPSWHNTRRISSWHNNRITNIITRMYVCVYISACQPPDRTILSLRAHTKRWRGGVKLTRCNVWTVHRSS